MHFGRVALTVEEELLPVQRNVIQAQTVTAGERPEFRQRYANAHLKTGRKLLVSGVPIVVDEVEAVVVPAKNIAAQCDILVEQIGLGEPELYRLRECRIVDAGAQFLPLAAEVTLADRSIDDEPFDRRETGGTNPRSNAPVWW